MLKGEGPALGVAEVVRASAGRYAVFAGHGGKEFDTPEVRALVLAFLDKHLKP